MTLKVIGAGVGRTGTLSLKAALERLGFGPCFHGRHVLDHPERLPMWRAAADGEAVDWHAVFAGYAASVDWPGAAYWRPLLETFPGAKVILTVRDAERWYDSVHDTIYQMFGDGPGDGDPRVAEARGVVPGLDVFTDFHRRMIWDGFFGGRFADRGHALAVYEAHNAAVLREVPPERLLVVEPGAGWEPLCEFLGVEVPDEPYPRLNDPAAFWSRVAARVAESRA
ncbi:sulfotransferase family protein [Sphaerisporangium sp. B11E5]|uniref:sulfotransferase family protein n=1 Tax=Sphaerisporangium sp. B11E5 TaxID=3153563 RepID=UPI00325E51B3